jgi:hypothetical protein
MPAIAANIAKVRAELEGTPCRLIAVTKTQPLEKLREAYEAGQRLFGENKVQEMAEKQPQLPSDVEWHLIGHLQTNKVKHIAPFVAMIHSVDSLKLLQEIDKRAGQCGRTIPCLFQIHIAEEETKFGLSEAELREILQSEAFASLSNVRMEGLMGMATNTEDEAQVAQEFRALKAMFDRIKAEFRAPNLDFREVSMGMSGDYPLAVAAGSTLVRVGSLLFGARQY